MVIDSSSGASVIRYQETSTTGWSNFVTRSWSTAVDVLQESNGGDFYHATNPWVVPATDGTDYYIRMYLQVGAAAADFEIRSIDSLDEEGTDFGLSCASSPTCSVSGGGTCAYGKLCAYDNSGVDRPADPDICDDPTDADCFHLDHAGHGRIGWNSVDDGPVNFSSDTPFMLFTGRGDTVSSGTPPTTCDDPSDELYDASWDASGGLWDVPVVTAGGKSCPDYEIDDAHDPCILPLLNGGFKAYYQDAADGQIPKVCYSDDGTPGSWEDCVAIEMGFEDGTPWNGSPADPRACVGDTTMFAYDASGTRHEGGFTVPQTGGGGSCFDLGEDGLIYISHEN